MEYQVIEPHDNLQLILSDPEGATDFCEAALESVAEFRDSFRKHLVNRDLEGLRGAGHKIKPGIQMMGALVVLEEYEVAKDMLEDDAEQKKLDSMASKMDTICSDVKSDIKKLLENKT